MARSPELFERIRAAANQSPRDFVNHYLFSVPPYAFRAFPSEYQDFRAELAARLDVVVDDITLVGSGRLGFSLNPEHLLRTFGARSDLDVVIVSSEVFDSTWTELLEKSTEIALAAEEERRRFKKTKENFFRGYLRPDHLPLTIGLASEWFPKLASRFASPVASSHEVQGWLFKSELHARTLYAEHLNRVQADILRILQLEEKK